MVNISTILAISSEKPTDINFSMFQSLSSNKSCNTATHKKGDDYLTYVGRASQTEITKAVKMSDLRHNMDPARLVDLSDKSMKRIQKYHVAYQFLLNVN